MKAAAPSRLLIALALAAALLPSIATADEDPFKVGVSLPLSGPFAEFGEAVRNGINLAAKEAPERFRNILFIYEDNQYEPKQAVSVFNKLVDLDKVNLVFLWGNEPSLAVAPIAETKHVPVAAVSQYAEVSAGKHFVFRFLNNGSDYSRAMIEFLRSLGVKRLVMLQAQLSFFEMLSASLKALLTPDERIEFVESVLPSTTDFRTIISKLKTKQFDILGVYLTPPQVGQFFKQAKELHFAPKTFGATTFESKLLLRDAWPQMEGAYFTHNAVTEEFQNRYLSTFGSDVQLAYAANAYDFAMLTSRLFESAHNLKPDEIISRFANSASQSGASGNYHASGDREHGSYFAFDVVVRKVQEGKSVEVYRKNYGGSKIE